VIAPQAPASSRFVEVRTGLGTGQVKSLDLTIKSDGSPLRVVLAYSDRPGPSLVNNLNLVVTAPDGRKFVGNQRRNGPPTFDTTNNVEVVHVSKPSAGAWRVDVVGSNVPQGPQDYALVAIAHL
jgi:hypothetical protein